MTQLRLRQASKQCGTNTNAQIMLKVNKHAVECTAVCCEHHKQSLHQQLEERQTADVAHGPHATYLQDPRWPSITAASYAGLRLGLILQHLEQTAKKMTDTTLHCAAVAATRTSQDNGLPR